MKLLFILTMLVMPLSAISSTLYVDLTIGNNCNNYDPVSRSCGAGSDTAFADTSSALTDIGAGDTLILREGTYGQLNIQRSGTALQPIIIQGADNESVVVSSSSVALMVVDQENITIKGLQVENVQGFGRIEGSSGITIDSIEFSNASSGGTTGSLKFVSSSYNQVLNSTFSEAADLLILQDNANFNLLENNSFASSSHSSISIRCSSKNVIRANIFNNPDQKAMEIYDCEAVSDAPFRLDDTKRNVIESNKFLGTKASSESYRYNAIQHGGQQTIVRNNVFADNLGGGVNFQYYPDESLYVYENRLYNNTFYNNQCYGLMGRPGVADRYYDNQAVNNLLYNNTSCSGENEQISISDPAAVILTNNSLLDSDPGFTDIGSMDLTLNANSEQIDAGAFVAHATSSGSGTTLVIDDAGWFYDGFGIPGETGDQVRIQGQNDTATIVSIDYPTNTLTLSNSLVWNDGDGVHLNYSGSAPDIGAFELGDTEISNQNVIPSSPSNLNVTTDNF